jgi:5'-methylthioadenosine phosphorylase
MVLPNLAIISDFELKDVFSKGQEIRVGTPFGPSMSMLSGKFGDSNIIYLSRREVEDEIPFRGFNYRANIWGINKIGVERIISLNYFRALDRKFAIGDLIMPNDLIDFTKDSPQTYYDKQLITPMDLSKPFCPDLRKHLMKSKSSPKKTRKSGIVACVGLPRFETVAERKMFTMLGCNLVNVGISPEIFLSRELRMCYGSIGIVCSKAEDLKSPGDRKSFNIEETLDISKNIITQSLANMPKRRRCSCSESE